jgi:4-amino-4-deoxychorismate lyase
MIHFCRGRYSPEGVTLDPSQPAFRYGAGFFETICYNGSRVCHLDLHLDRLFHALRAHDIPHAGEDFPAVIDQLLDRNGLVGREARIDIFYPVEEPEARAVVTAAPFEAKPYKAYRLCRCSDHHVSSLAVHRTACSMFFHLAMRQAGARGFDGAALTDFGENLLEATGGALLFSGEDGFVEPETGFKLPSVALGLARTALDVAARPVHSDDLPHFRHAYILNSMIGMRPVVAIGETAFVPDEEACRTVSELVLEESL